MSKTRRNTIFIALGLVAFVGLWTWLLLTYGADGIVSYLGAENGYLVMFLVALFGGMSSFSGVTYVATILTLAGGGLNPLSLALAAGAGTTIGDTIYYYIGRYGVREVAESYFSNLVSRATAWLSQKPSWAVFLGSYLYTGFTPLPNDVLTITLGLTHQPLRVVLPALALGNATLTYLIATFGGSLPFLN
jgi:membrane protein DedA with SNARE-associated domain